MLKRRRACNAKTTPYSACFHFNIKSIRHFFSALLCSALRFEWGTLFIEAETETVETNFIESKSVLLLLLLLFCYILYCARCDGYIHRVTTVKKNPRNDKYHGHRRRLPRQHCPMMMTMMMMWCGVLNTLGMCFICMYFLQPYPQILTHKHIICVLWYACCIHSMYTQHPIETSSIPIYAK